MYICNILVVLLFLASCSNINGDGIETNDSDIPNNSIMESGSSTVESSSDVPGLQVGAFLDDLSAKKYGVSESANGLINTSTELRMRTDTYQDEKASLTVQYELNGQQIELTYVNSEKGPLMNDVIHRYSYYSEIDKKTTWVWLNGDTGEYVALMLPILNPAEDAPILTIEQQQEIAYEFLCEHVQNPEEFQIIDQGGDETFQAFFYARFVWDMETCERVTVFVESTGKISYFILRHVNEMSDIPTIPETVLEMAHKELERRAHDMCGGLGDGYTYTYETNIDRLVRLDDGSLALDCVVDINITYPDEGDVSVGAWFIIPITEPTQ